VAYPNPTSDLVTLHLKTEGEISELVITLFNMIGVPVYHGTIPNNSQISLSSLGLSNGLYLVRVEAYGITETVRIVVMGNR